MFSRGDFGCEAGDRMNAAAFGRNNPFGAKLNGIFSSDIGHFDVIEPSVRGPPPRPVGRLPLKTRLGTEKTVGTKSSSTTPSVRSKPHP